jgi:hypothetical protein
MSDITGIEEAVLVVISLVAILVIGPSRIIKWLEGEIIMSDRR